MNWLSITSNALWILALAWALTLVGVAYWESFEQEESLLVFFSRPKMRGSINLALTVFSLGLGLITNPVWGKVLWFVLALLSLTMAWSAFNLSQKKR
jgi:hypothetical protein